MTDRYLVQTRQHGERWKTHTPTLDLASATSYADSLARMIVALGDPSIPRYFEVRVTRRGAVVYDPRTPGRA